MVWKKVFTFVYLVLEFDHVDLMQVSNVLSIFLIRYINLVSNGQYKISTSRSRLNAIVPEFQKC